MADDDVFVPAAASISDGEAVDWSSFDAVAGDARQERLIQQLRIVAEIADVYRRTHLASEGTERAPSRFRHLRDLEPLARGGFGDVYRAWDPQLERQVALKLLRPALGMEADETLREGRLQASVRHSHVVTVYGADRFDGRTGIWMELIQGQTLADLVRERGTLGAGEAIVIGLDLCRARAAVHAAGLVHRDVKAQNAMRERGGRIVLMDLGLGRAVRDDAPTELAGTPSYMAPELVLDAVPASVRSDIYALGVLLFHLVTGAFPVEGRDLAALRAAHGEGRRRHLRDARPDLPSRFVAVVERALASHPEDRYASAGALEVALSQAVEPSVSGAASQAQPEERAAPAGRTRPPWILAGLTALAVWAVSTQRGPPSAASSELPRADAGMSVEEGARSTLAPSNASSEETASARSGGAGAPGDPFVAPIDPSGRLEERAAGEATNADAYGIQLAWAATDEGLRLEHRATRALWLYVLGRDDQGQPALLFPLPGVEPESPLAGRERHRLPARLGGGEAAWTAAEVRGGLLVIASPGALVGFENEIRALRLPRTGPVRRVPLSSETLAQLQTALDAAGAGASAFGRPGRLFDLARPATDHQELVRGVWIRRVEWSGRNAAPSRE